MDLAFCIHRLAANAETVRSLTLNVSDEQARWKHTPRAWSMVEVINHLYDEEREDFRLRLDYVLHRPGEPWPGIDPDGWAVERGYITRDLRASTDDFVQERRRSIDWLQTLPEPNWSASYQHPRFGAIMAGDLLAAWLAHDLLHIRQLTRLHYEYVALQMAPHSLIYAGEW